MASQNISFDSIPSSIRKPGKYFEFNTKLAVRTLPNNKQRMLIIGQRTKAFVETALFQGSGTDDATSGGNYTGTSRKEFRVKISVADTTDSFKWSSDSGASWSSDVAITGAAQALSDGVTVTFGATTGHTLDDEWRFHANPEPTVAQLIPTQVFSDKEAETYFGSGSMCHLMVRAAITANPYLDLTAVALDDGIGLAQGTVEFSGQATSAGAITLYVANQKVEVAISAGDLAGDIASALSAAINAKADLPVTASIVTTGEVTLNAKNIGLCGNQIGIGYDLTNVSGVTVTPGGMTGGTTDPSVQDALTAVFAEKYDIIVTPFTNDTAMGDLKDHLDAVSGPLEQRPGIAVYGMNGPLTDATTLAGQVDHGRIVSAYLRYTNSKKKSMPCEIASAMAAVMAYEEDPARPLNTLELKGIAAPEIGDRLPRNEQETCLYGGVTPLEVAAGETVRIVRAVSTYTTDTSLLDITTIRTLDYVRKACRERVALRFPREKLSSKTPPKVRSELLDVLLKLEDLEIVENVADNNDGLIVEKDLQDPNRLNAKIPTDVVNGLHVFAGRIDLIL